MFKALTLGALIVASLTTQGCYLARNALHHNDLFNARRRIVDVLDDPSTPEKTKERLRFATEVLEAARGYGLNVEGSYRYFIDTGEPVVSYLVQAAPADRLVAKTWWFPVVGRVPYLGFFRREDRDARAAELEAEGYDVERGAAGAFSSLGWFEDPIFSSMLVRSDADLAHLLFHELVHRTLWIPGSTAFNEQLAEYLGEFLTEQYLRANGRTEELARYLGKRDDRRAFHAWLKRLERELKALYAERRKIPRDALLARKRALFERHATPPEKPRFASVDYVGKPDRWNNATVLASTLYAPDLERFAKAHRCLGPGANVGAFLDAVERATGRGGDPFRALDALCAGG